MARLLNIFGVFCIIATGNGAKLSLNNLEAFEDAIGNDRIQLGDQVPASSFTGALVLVSFKNIREKCRF
ncbi:unnamed protein product [Allacma fusca]|uniref:Uncharacterized protein n=1 Tax=Allacma fusca TaxID=39272 RepID=A0A8J2KXY8_9HEXA|nr:unnamed protein product [Allacma fusca]